MERCKTGTLPFYISTLILIFLLAVDYVILKSERANGGEPTGNDSTGLCILSMFSLVSCYVV